jgi:hypothetical protein
MLFNPFDPEAAENAKNELTPLNFDIEVYPKAVLLACLEAVKLKSSIKPPKCIFIPSREIMR